MTVRSKVRTVRTLWRVYRHRQMGHALLVDPGAVTCQTCTARIPTGAEDHKGGIHRPAVSR